ncbi:hypothetical protein F2Q69_00007897 [Brassica cretica]|uniref:Uncharacterized protein n=1 Tax=Brassica cretica TaxID=69181 RepID=A0A8S9PHQ2_BRACR|nr:hypothetical protein F2Q69_00007897 [Brassica cretica]
MDWSCSKSNSGTLICQAVGLFFFVIPKLLHTRRIGSFTFLRCFSPPSHLPLLLHIPFVFINLNCTEVKTLEVIDLYPWTRDGPLHRKLCHKGRLGSVSPSGTGTDHNRLICPLGGIYALFFLEGLKVITREDENGNVKLECPAISKQQFTAGRFHIDSPMTATKDAARIARLDVIRIIYQ